MTVSSITDLTAATSNSAYVAGGELGKDEFMQLLVKQIQAQDPLNPMDSTEFISQLAQFSSLEQLMNMNDKLEDLTAKFSGAASLIDREVEALGSFVNVEDGVPDAIYLDLDSDATAVFASISNSEGLYVRTLELGPLSEGKQAVTWDGTDDNGNPVPDGKYTLEIQAVGTDGETIQATSLIKGIVSGATFEDGMTYLLINGSEVPLDSVTKITQGPEDD